MSSSTVSSFWKEHASATLPGNCSSTKPRTASGDMPSTSGGSCSVVADTEHLLQCVAAKPESERLERDDFLRRDVPEGDRRAELLDEPRRGRLAGRLEDDVRRADRVRDLADQLGAHAARRVEDA